MTKRVGVFDSGIGGFSVLRELFKQLPGCEFYYIADTEFCPYGEKDEQQILARSREITKLLIDKEVDVVVLACNTATAHAIDDLREEFSEVEFVGVEPYINAINKIDDFDKSKKWLSLTTLRTSQSKRYQHLLSSRDPENRVETLVISELVPLIEDLYYQRTDAQTMQEKLSDLLRPIKEKSYDHIILGCTHYPLIKRSIQTATGAAIFDPSLPIALRTLELLKISEDSKENIDTFYFYSTDKNQWITEKRNHLDLFE